MVQPRLHLWTGRMSGALARRVQELLHQTCLGQAYKYSNKREMLTYYEQVKKKKKRS